MTKANECTCPSGDGSLRHPCPAHPALVEQAGGDERAAFRPAQVISYRPGVGEVTIYVDGRVPGYMNIGDTVYVSDRAPVEQPSAALAQPSPALPPFAEKVLAKLRRFNECAEDSGSGGVDIGRHWLDLLTQLGLLNRVQRSPALWEISQQGDDLLGTPQPSPAQAEKAEVERPEVAEVAFVLRNIGAMDAEDIDGDNVDLRFEDAEGRDTGCDVSIVEYAEKAADLFEQHDRIVGALRAENAKLSEALDRWPLIRDSLKLRLADALARVEELEKELAMARDAAAKGDAARRAAGGMEMEIQELREKVTELQKELRSRWTYASTQATNCAGCGEYKHTPLRVDWMGGYVCLTCIDKKLEELHDDQAQHSVPEGYALIPVRETEAMHDAVMALLYKGVARTDTQKLLDAYIAAVPGKEVGHE
ncbi:TPA: hypothetical protein NII65_002146 [Pseudomonas aeruginosa]|uniref:hypothetical protein n=1 Tax=Pseudomonas aeruginosa TaxID=287 RepID=UPI003D2CE6BE|nr:hypothetical protein [Pseudomonas aeruginosa]